MLFRLFTFFAFKIDPETAHRLAFFVFSFIPDFLVDFFWGCISEKDRAKYELDVAGIAWDFPVGLAAGFDKNAEALGFLSRLSFGAVEVGTVTPRPQQGNSRPRIFRYPGIRSLRNSMGFPNEGMQRVLGNIRSSKRGRVLGINIGKNKDTLDGRAFEDYRELYRFFAGVGDYLVLNVSSPNTPGLRALQRREELEKILGSLGDLREQSPCPLFLKISPDLDGKTLRDVVDVALEFKLAGIVVSNTQPIESYGPGGMSGDVLRDSAREARRRVLELTAGTGLEVIGAGGISSFEDILDFWRQGGKVVQIYTSFIYQGPSLLREIRDGIDLLMREKNVRTVKELVDCVRGGG